MKTLQEILSELSEIDQMLRRLVDGNGPVQKWKITAIADKLGRTNNDLIIYAEMIERNIRVE